MKTFFEPKSLAILGATDNPSKPPYFLLQNLLKFGYQGRVYPVNPRIKEIMGVKVYDDVRSLPEPVDLAMILLPRDLIPDAVSACGEKGIRSVIIGSAGFAEKDEIGGQLMEETLKRAREHRIRIMGPNSIGTTNTRLKFTTAFIDAVIPTEGPVSLVTQTGSVGGPLLHWLGSISKTACIGNRSDIDADEIVSYFADDPDTKVVGVHSEGFNHPRRFIEAVQKCTAAQKPVVLFKAGNTSEGARIATSHTGSMSSEYKMLLVAARQAGAVLVDDFEDFFDSLKLMALPAARSLDFGTGIVSISGAGLVMAGDICSKLGLPIAAASGEGANISGKALYDIGSWSGEMDVNKLYYDMGRQALGEPAVKYCLFYIIPTPKLFYIDVDSVFSRLKEEFNHKAILAVVYGHRGLCADWTQKLETLGIPCYSSAQRGLKAISKYREWLTGSSDLQ
jgi:acyl-CoA synthetase (NDP forming)